ncbi:Tetratricopeptide-like helical [Niveomyces insectorum RCEF 264]|uniref:Tetratricopeptide-like helical n=1 Tax=Niveomyces insectorum RCEF 264 TaxID=1081102 RepID=A0A167M4Z2_9HYPO|nr:Tetratricopeptide-like helical [Niveomyces insectorum RCEF 264]
MAQILPNTQAHSPGLQMQAYSPQKAWETAVKRARRELKPKSFATLLRVANYETCLSELQARNNAFAAKWPRLGPVVGRVLDLLKTFDVAISTCCQSHPEIACLVWGGVQIVLTVAAKYRDCARRMSDMFEQLSLSMPRFEDYMRYFPTNDRLQLRLISVFEIFVIFCARAFKFLSSRLLTAIAWATWSSLDQKLTKAVEQIKEIKGEMENEARAANIGIGFERETAAKKRHQDVMALLPAAVNRVRLVESTVLVTETRNGAFIGRANELKILFDYFSSSQAEGKAEPCVVTICGLGGAGKTQLALEYLYQNKLDYRGRFWIRAESQEIIQHDFAMIGRLLSMPNDAVVTDLKKAVQMASDWLTTTDDKWLLVFDNVDNAADIREYLPTVGRGSVVVTTQDRDTADRLSQWSKIVLLEGMQKTDAAALLQQIMPDIPHEGMPHDNLEATIIDEFGGLPLAICQMGSYIRQTQCTLSQFYDILQSRSDRFYCDTASIATLSYTKTLAQCCDMSIELLSEDERYLLGVIALFQIDEVQEELITHGCRSVARLQHLDDAWNWNSAIRDLSKHMLVTVMQKKSQRSLHMHRVLKRRALHVLEAEPARRTQAFRDAAILLNAVFPKRPSDGGTMTKLWGLCEMWLPHVLSLRGASVPSKGQPNEDTPRELAEILCNCSWYMWERGTQHAFEFAAHALDVCKQTQHGDDDTLLSDMYTVVGALKMVSFQSQREGADAFQEALRIRERYMEKTDSPSLDERRLMANSYNNAGVGRLILREYPEATRLIQKSLALKLTLGNEATMPYDFAVSFYNLCRIDMEQGQVEEAKEHCKKALDLAEACNGPDDYRTNQFRFTYADLLVESGEWEDAFALHKQTLDIRTRVMGNENNDTAVSYYGLSCLYQKREEFANALTSIENAIKIFEKVPGAEDRLARSYFRKYLLMKTSQEDEASKALSAAKRYRKILVGEEQDSKDTDTMEDYNLLVSYYNR